MTRSRVIISFIPLSMALLAALSLTACVEVSAIRVIPSTVSTNQIETHSEQVASVKGWVSVANYIPAHGSKLIVTLYMKYKGQKLVVAEQVYQNSHLPVRYFFPLLLFSLVRGQCWLKLN